MEFKLPDFPCWMPESAKEHWFFIKEGSDKVYENISKSDREVNVKQDQSRCAFAFPAFESDVLKQFWQSLDQKEPEKRPSICRLFTQELLSYEGLFYSLCNMKEEDREELKILKEKLPKSLKRTATVLEELNSLGTTIYNDPVLKRLPEQIDEYIQYLDILVNNEKTKRENQKVFPISRETKKKSALHIFVIRQNYLFFMKRLGKPMHQDNADVVNVLFDTDHSYDYIAKTVQTAKNRELVG